MLLLGKTIEFSLRCNPPLHTRPRPRDTTSEEQALPLVPLNRTRERLVLTALHRYGVTDAGIQKALLALPRGSRLLFIHSYTRWVCAVKRGKP